MDIELRKAIQADIKEIKTLLSFYYLDTEKVEKNLPEFMVAVLDKKTVGCACLDIGGAVELRSIAVLPSYRNKGIGSRMVGAILSRAAELADTVYLRTTSPAFFEKKGFKRLPDEEKKAVWDECAQCEKYDICRQTVMKFILSQYPAVCNGWVPTLPE
ncbi:MAG: GNAT family N-acetyltransferase [Candidatus Methanoperedens sp.]|nr:GNAT family N-acetyltransferase [Candidatus Methanoperedens sp.]